MALYEPIDNRKLGLSYLLDDLSNSTNRLQTGITDNFATLSLAKLIGGGIKSFDELQAAEQCLRSLIFHETVVRQSPSVMVNNMMYQELKFEKDPINLNDYIGTDIIHHHLGRINSLKSFTDINEANAENIRRKNKIKKQKESYLKSGTPEPVFSLDFDNCPLEKVADDVYDYTKSAFAIDSSLQSRFILPIAASKLPSYISYPFLIKNFEHSIFNTDKVFQANEFFNSIDDIWKLYNERLRNKIDVQIPLFLTIVLGRSKSREDIGRVILELREEFEKSRNQLWGIFDQLDDANISQSTYVKTLTDVEDSTKDIFKSILLPNSKSESMLSLDNYKRFGSILNAGVVIYSAGALSGYEAEVATFIAFTNSLLNSFTVGNSFNISAARLTANYVKDLDNQKLLTKILTPQELDSVKYSLRNHV